MRQRPTTLEAIGNGEHLLHDHQDKLSPQQTQEMRERITELREYFDTLIGLSHERNGALRDLLNKLETDYRRKVCYLCLIFIVIKQIYYFAN